MSSHCPLRCEVWGVTGQTRRVTPHTSEDNLPMSSRREPSFELVNIVDQAQHCDVGKSLLVPASPLHADFLMFLLSQTICPFMLLPPTNLDESKYFTINYLPKSPLKKFVFPISGAAHGRSCQGNFSRWSWDLNLSLCFYLKWMHRKIRPDLEKDILMTQINYLWTQFNWNQTLNNAWQKTCPVP